MKASGVWKLQINNEGCEQKCSSEMEHRKDHWALTDWPNSSQIGWLPSLPRNLLPPHTKLQVVVSSSIKSLANIIMCYFLGARTAKECHPAIELPLEKEGWGPTKE